MKLWMRVVISVGLIGLLGYLIDWGQFREALTKISPLVWAGVLLGFVAGHLVGVFKWRLNVNVGRGKLGRIDAVQCYSAGLFSNMWLPSIVGGDVVRAVLAGRATGRHEAAIFGGVADRLIDMGALCVLVVIGGIWVQPHVDGWLSYALIFGFVVAGAGLFLFLPFILKMKLEKWPAKVRRKIGRILVAMRRLVRRPGTAALVLMLSLGIQSSFVLLNAWLGRSVGIDIPLAAWFLAWPLAKVVALVPISMGGLGVREYALATILAQAPMNIDEGPAVIVSLLWQAVLYAGALTSGLFWLILGLRPDAHMGAGHGSLASLVHNPNSEHA